MSGKKKEDGGGDEKRTIRELRLEEEPLIETAPTEFTLYETKV